MRSSGGWARLSVGVVGLLFFAGCGEGAPRAERSDALVRIDGVPHVLQKRDFCGEAAAEMYLRKLGHAVDQDQVFALSGMDPARGMGATTKEMKVALERLGFRTGPVWLRASAERAREDMQARWDELHADLAAGVPSIVCTHFDEQPETTEHFRLVLGYDPARDEVIYHDPALKQGAYLRMPRARLLALWPLKYDPKQGTVIRLRLEPDDIEVPEHADSGKTPADFAQHVMELRDRLPHGFTIVIEPPFVVIGDARSAEVRAWAQGTVRRAVRALRKDFFARDPAPILDIFLFQDADSYERHTRLLFGHRPSTPYGYFDEEAGALVMNIATGGGTLIHELVHPYMHENFPNCPPWFNEGLGSLYEGSRIHEGSLLGVVNWRLPGLQQAIRDKQSISLQALTAKKPEQYYRDETGVNYALARYLLMYLQERGLLQRYYREFHAAAASDPTGYVTLMQVLGRTRAEMPAFEDELRRFILELK